MKKSVLRIVAAVVLLIVLLMCLAMLFNHSQCDDYGETGFFVELRVPVDMGDMADLMNNMKIEPYLYKLVPFTGTPPVDTSMLDKLYLDMPIQEARRILGVPHYLDGNGFIMDAYRLNDGSELVINYGANRETLWRAVQYHSDGSFTMIVE